jgi:hypothetical protein
MVQTLQHVTTHPRTFSNSLYFPTPPCRCRARPRKVSLHLCQSPRLQTPRCPPPNRSVSTASRDRYSSTPMYAPHTRRLPSNADRPCNTRWLSTLSTVPGVNCTQCSESALVSSVCHVRIASYLTHLISRVRARSPPLTKTRPSRHPNGP